MKFKQEDILYAVIAIVVFIVAAATLNKCEAAEPEWYSTVGFGFTKEDNVFCRQGDTLGTYGIINFGYRFDESLALQYRHNSCIDKEQDEGSLDAVELLFEFK